MDKYTGKKLDGRYEIQELIGIGGMAVVYRAYDTIDDRTVAIKILKDEFLSNEDFIRRFKNESKAIAILSHPNIVKVFDVSFGDRMQYIVMEYIDGITLKEYIDQQHDIKWKEAVHFTVQILRALQHAHEKGIVHRDIKPQNIMLLQDGTIKVTDFGIARFSRNETRTMTDKAIGSVHYIAPEQARGDITDEKADIYSVGVMLYEMLTGQLPFEADNAVSVAIMQLQADPRPPRDINPAIPEGLEEITLKAMQKDCAHRYQSAAEMLEAIEQFKRNPSITFEYKYFVDDKPTKYLDAINSVRRATPEPDYDDDYAYEVEETKAKKSPAVHIIGGIIIAVVLAAIVFGSITFFQSCGGEENQDIEVPNFVGMMIDEINQKKEAGEYKFTFEVESVYQEGKRLGEVLDQDPKPGGKKVKENTTIKLTVNSDSALISVPDGKTLTEKEAIDKLKAEGLSYEVVPVTDDNVPEGIVIETSPVAGTKVQEKTEVKIMVSQGPEVNTVAVPEIINRQFDDAKKMLEAAGLKVGNPVEKDSDKEKGTVLESDPMPGVPVAEGTTVSVIVSNGKKTEKSVTVKIRKPSNIDQDVNWSVYIDGTRVEEKIINPSYGQSLYEVVVTATGGQKGVVVTINGGQYYSCTVDFDNDGKITEQYKEINLPSSEPEPDPDSSQSEPSNPEDVQ